MSCAEKSEVKRSCELCDVLKASTFNTYLRKSSSLQIPFSFAIELWGVGDYKGARCFDLFNPRSEHLQVRSFIPGSNRGGEILHPRIE